MSEPDPGDPWERAIQAAENGRRAEALEAFRSAIESRPDYYVSVIQPAGAVARACWEEAVRRFVREADAKSEAGESQGMSCTRCGKDVGLDWHYPFEHIVLCGLVGTQCRGCGAVVCRDDITYGPDGNYPPCPQCGNEAQTLREGPASSSMVEAAVREHRYRGAVKDPATMGRPVEKG